MASDPKTAPVTGRCYCGTVRFSVDALPQTVAYCHCIDCRRITGAPVAAFAAFGRSEAGFVDSLPSVSASQGVERWFCKQCGSPLAAYFAYLPDQIYIPLGVLDYADRFAPQVHCHADAALLWLHIADDLTRVTGSAREVLR